MPAAGSEMWRMDVLYDIMDGKNGQLVAKLGEDSELKTWKCKKVGDECQGFTVLHAAVRYGNSAALSLLLSNGAVGIGIKDKDNRTPLEWAVINAHRRHGLLELGERPRADGDEAGLLHPQRLPLTAPVSVVMGRQSDGSLELLQNKTLSTQPIASFDWNQDKEGLAVMGVLDQTLRVCICTKLNLA